MSSAEQLLDGLRGAGHRLTRARKTVVTVLAEAGKPVTVPDLVERLCAAGVAVNKTTAYREVAFLIDRGLAAAVELGDGAKRYELVAGEHHHHFVCTSCNDITEVEVEDGLKRVLASVGLQTGAAVTGHAVEFFGTCKACL